MSALSNRPVVWGGFVAAVVAAVIAAYVIQRPASTPSAPTASTAPTGDESAPPTQAQRDAAARGQLPVVAVRKTDPGQEYYRQGRYDLAIAFWTKAADAGDALAAHELAVEYMDGKPMVVQRDYEKARKYHLQAAQAGDPRSMFDLGSMYEFGMGVTVDLRQAAVWYRHAAEYGHPQGAYNLGTMLESGEAGQQDLVEAYKFYKLAADGGFDGVPYDNNRLRIDRNAPSALDLISRKMTSAQIEEGKSRAKAFKFLTGPLKT
jgi:TPR repeat protein